MKKIYPFDTWFYSPPGADGRVRILLKADEHYTCSQSSMVQQLRTAAAQRGLRITITDLRDSIHVTVVHDQQARLDRIEAERTIFASEKYHFNDEGLRSRKYNA